MLPALLAGPIVAAVVALVIGFFCVRLTHAYFIMLTLAFGQLVYTVFWKWHSATGGDDGLTGIMPHPLLASQSAYYMFVLVIVLASAWALYRIGRSPFGSALLAIKDNPRRAAFLGIDVRRMQLAAFTVAGTFAGIAGRPTGILSAWYVPHLRALAALSRWLRRSVHRRRQLLFRSGGGSGAAETVAALRASDHGVLALHTRVVHPLRRARPACGVVEHDSQTAGMSDSVLIVEDLSRNFGGVQAVKDVNLAVPAGQLRAVIGPNGAGKSTFFNLLTGYIPCNSGRILFRGKDVTGLPPHSLCCWPGVP